MIEILVIGAAALGAARWLKQDTQRRDHDPQSQVRSDYLDYKQNEDRIVAQIKRAKLGRP